MWILFFWSRLILRAFLSHSPLLYLLLLAETCTPEASYFLPRHKKLDLENSKFSFEICNCLILCLVTSRIAFHYFICFTISQQLCWILSNSLIRHMLYLSMGRFFGATLKSRSFYSEMNMLVQFSLKIWYEHFAWAKEFAYQLFRSSCFAISISVMDLEIATVFLW